MAAQKTQQPFTTANLRICDAPRLADRQRTVTPWTPLFWTFERCRGGVVIFSPTQTNKLLQQGLAIDRGNGLLLHARASAQDIKSMSIHMK